MVCSTNYRLLEEHLAPSYVNLIRAAEARLMSANCNEQGVSICVRYGTLSVFCD